MSTSSLFPPSGEMGVSRQSASSDAGVKDGTQPKERPGLLERIMVSFGCLGYRSGGCSNRNDSTYVTPQGSESPNDVPLATNYAGECQEDSIVPPTTSDTRSSYYQNYNESTLHQATNERRRFSFSTCPTIRSSIVDDTSSTTSISDNLDSEQVRRRERNEEQINYVFFRLAGCKLSDGHINHRANILCTGSGVGAWAVCLEYPRSKVVILDKEPYSRYLPPNCTTEAGDIAEYPRNFFWDYVYVRNLRGIGDCGAYFDSLRGIVRSEGHIELVDIDDAYDVVCTCSQLGDWVKISTPGWTSKSINAFKLGHASRCQICASFPTARRRRDLLRQSGFCKLTITYHARPGLTMHRAKISSVAITGTACKV